jgi:hypothetical protein
MGGWVWVWGGGWGGGDGAVLNAVGAGVRVDVGARRRGWRYRRLAEYVLGRGRRGDVSEDGGGAGTEKWRFCTEVCQ